MGSVAVLEPSSWSMVSALVALAALGVALWNALTARGRKEYDQLIRASALHEERLIKVEGVVARDLDHDHRLAKVESVVSGLPKAAEFHDMRVAMEAMRGTISVIAERVKPIEAIAHRLQEVLLEKPR